MHEMAVVSSIVDSICSKAEEVGAERIVSLTLFVGELRDFHEGLVQKYFDYFSRGSLADGVKVSMYTVPFRYRCDQCGALYRYDKKSRTVVELTAEEGTSRSKTSRETDGPTCLRHPDAQLHMISGTELYIDQIEVV